MPVSSSVPCIALCAATNPEASLLRKQLAIFSTSYVENQRFDFGTFKESSSPHQPFFLLIQTGMGTQNAEKGLRYGFEHFQISEVWVFGVAGALTPTLKAASLILTEAAPQNPPQDPQTTSLSNHSIRRQLTEFFRSNNIAFNEAAITTAEHLVATSEDKITLGSKTKAELVTMESAPLMRICSEKNIEFTELRWIFDEACEGFPQKLAELVDQNGNIRPFKTTLTLITHPLLLIQAALWGVRSRSVFSKMNNFVGQWMAWRASLKG